MTNTGLGGNAGSDGRGSDSLGSEDRSTSVGSR